MRTYDVNISTIHMRKQRLKEVQYISKITLLRSDRGKT